MLELVESERDGIIVEERPPPLAVVVAMVAWPVATADTEFTTVFSLMDPLGLLLMFISARYESLKL